MQENTPVLSHRQPHGDLPPVVVGLDRNSGEVTPHNGACPRRALVSREWRARDRPADRVPVEEPLGSLLVANVAGRPERSRYSARSASTGLMRAARLAGKTAATSAMPSSRASATT